MLRGYTGENTSKCKKCRKCSRINHMAICVRTDSDEKQHEYVKKHTLCIQYKLAYLQSYPDFFLKTICWLKMWLIIKERNLITNV